MVESGLTDQISVVITSRTCIAVAPLAARVCRRTTFALSANDRP
jgi:hypothetical protein